MKQSVFDSPVHLEMNGDDDDGSAETAQLGDVDDSTASISARLTKVRTSSSPWLMLGSLSRADVQVRLSEMR